MRKQKDEDKILSQFLKESTPEVQHLLHPEIVPQVEEAPALPKGPPIVPSAATAEPEALKAFWRGLRLFYRTGKGGGLSWEGGSPGLRPALMGESQKQASAPYEYPFFAGEDQQGKELFTPLYPLLEAAASEKGIPRVLTDNLPLLEHLIRTELAAGEHFVPAADLFETATQKLEQQLALSGPEGNQLSEGLKELFGRISTSGYLIGFSDTAHFQILATVLEIQRSRQRSFFEKEVAPLIARIEERLEVEHEKNPEAVQPERLHDAYDFADTYINFKELSSVLPPAGSEVMPSERRHRLEKVLDTLKKAADNLFRHDALLLLPSSFSKAETDTIKRIFNRTEIHQVPEGKLCIDAAKSFDGLMARLAPVFAALRIAQLELSEQYRPEVHQDFFAHFDWHLFTSEEMELCSPAIGLSLVDDLMRTELNHLSYLISTSRPIKFMVVKRDAQVGYQQVGAPKADQFVFQPELGALAVSFRNPYVLQSTAVTPAHMYQGINHGLSLPLPAIFYVLAPSEDGHSTEEHYRWTSAAVEGREFPAFLYDSQAGPQWGSRFDIGVNPQLEKDWAVYSLTVKREKEEETWTLPFTFADFLAQDEAYKEFFLMVPPSFWTEDLVSISDYLTLTSEERYSKVPFVWMEDQSGQLQKVALARRVVHLSRERLDFWHYLQENAGVNSYHVNQAMAIFRDKLIAKTESEVAALKASQEAALMAAREEGSSTAMERLAAALLDMDMDLTAPVKTTSSPVATSSTSTPKTETSSVEVPVNVKFKEVSETETEEEDDEPLLLGEAYIDTVLCTTCNECTNFNNRIFKYNEDKQAYVANPKGGPFSDIVMAAEKCPAGIIHPGAPQNPNEEELDEWVKRAEPFNR